jgi:hypothetical protein
VELPDLAFAASSNGEKGFVPSMASAFDWTLITAIPPTSSFASAKGPSTAV